MPGVTARRSVTGIVCGAPNYGGGLGRSFMSLGIDEQPRRVRQEDAVTADPLV